MNFLKNIFNKNNNIYGIDLGTANTIVINSNYEILYNEPSIVAFNEKEKKLIAIGNKANEMLGRTPKEIKTIKPLKDGVIQYFEITQMMLNEILKRIKKGFKIIPPKIIIGVPSVISEIEKRAVKEATKNLGVRDTILVEEALAASAGMGLNINKAGGNLIVDIGGGTTEIAVISLEGIVCVNTLKLASEAINEEIINFIKKEKNLIIGEKTAEEIKRNLADLKEEKNNKIKIKGRNNKNGLPLELEIKSNEINSVLKTVIDKIIDCIKETLENTPPELAGDIYDKGIILTGGGSLLNNIDFYISDKLNLPVIQSPTPLFDVAYGTIKIYKQKSIY
ncbi:MAG TPA: rod shape-determining protein [bacterium]|nr:rod shape-determining protein [bacterium]HOL47003.1 rod shape-determining protein [bacterium]HPQ19001.1 rod shape-determining protein [bacterium]